MNFVARARNLPTAVAVLSGATIAFELGWRAYGVDAGTAGAVQAVIVLFALISASLLYLRVREKKRLSDLLLLGALTAVAIPDFVFLALPTLTGVGRLRPNTAAAVQLMSQALVAVSFLTAATAPRTKLVSHTGRGIAWAVAVPVGAVAGIALVSELLDAGSAGGRQLESAIVAITCTPALLGAAVAFWRRASEERSCRLLAAAAIALAPARMQYLALPAGRLSWITPADGLRLVGYALFLLAVVIQFVDARSEANRAALDAERERIARDLHDGLAQDLAFIAAHARRFVSDWGPDHPLSVAAHRALATTRGTMVDLSASNAPTAEAALRQVAAELEDRFGVDIEVEVAQGERDVLAASDREAVVRITREAIVNAVTHGGAGRILVALDADESELRLRIRDDGRGISEPSVAPGRGFGLPAMRARASALGGALVARRVPTGGTELELTVP